MSSKLSTVMDGWRFDPGADTRTQIAAMLESIQAAGLLRASTNSVLLGEQYHLGGVEDTRRMAAALGLTGDDRVLDLACYVGGPARQLALEHGCQVVGVDFSEDCIAIAEKLTELVGLQERVTFMCESADAVPLPDESFTVAWSQCSMPSDLSWLKEMDRLLKPGGRLAFTGVIRRAACDDPALLALGDVRQRIEAMGYRVVAAEDISDMELAHGWLPELAKLRANEAHYGGLMGSDWVHKARVSIETDIAAWREARMGEGRVVAVKE